MRPREKATGARWRDFSSRPVPPQRQPAAKASSRAFLEARAKSDAAAFRRHLVEGLQSDGWTPHGIRWVLSLSFDELQALMRADWRVHRAAWVAAFLTEPIDHLCAGCQDEP